MNNEFIKFEEDFKQRRWLIFFIIFAIMFLKKIIANTIGEFTYNFLISIVAIMCGCYLQYWVVKYLKYDKEKNMKYIKLGFGVNTIIVWYVVIFVYSLMTV